MQSTDDNFPLCRLHSVYPATEGEGIHLGHPQVFVRFQGCAIGCVNCDSQETWDFAVGKNWVVADLVEEIERFGVKRVSITGGDPLHPKHVPSVLALVAALKSQDAYFINIEAAGTRVVKEIFDAVDFISYDYKTPSTGVKTSRKLLLQMVHDYPGKYQIKSVIQDRKDFDETYSAWQEVSQALGDRSLVWVLTPAYGTNESFPQDRFREIFDWNFSIGGPFRVIGQQHKWIYGPKEMLV